jgi:hypothetical protein
MSTALAQSETPRCVSTFDKVGGITTSRELVQGLSLMMGDLAAGRMTNGRANAICNAAGKILTTVELEQQYGARPSGTDPNASPMPTLQLVGGSVAA